MITSVQNISLTQFLASNKRLLIVIGLVLLSNAGVFGQTAVTEVTFPTEAGFTKSEQAVALDTDMDFMNWFMGTNQNQNHSDSSNSNTISTKKQFINSGVTPNRVLYKTLLKKVSSMDRALV
jgi:hypothetical protein